jgi:hypothetical protein
VITLHIFHFKTGEHFQEVVLPSRDNFLISTRLGASLYGHHPGAKSTEIFQSANSQSPEQSQPFSRKSNFPSNRFFCVLVRFQRRTEQFIQFYGNEAAGRNRHVVWGGESDTICAWRARRVRAQHAPVH